VAWRRIQIEGEKYRWTVGHERLTNRYTEPAVDLFLTVVVRGPGNFKVHATFHGFSLLDVWQKERMQNLAVPTGVVRALVEHARQHDLQRIDHAEKLFPETVLPKDRDGEFRAAAFRQWFQDENTETRR